MTDYQCASPGCHGTDLDPCRCGHVRLDRVSAPQANAAALRTLALWDLAEPMARLLLEVSPFQSGDRDNVWCGHCKGPMLDVGEDGPYAHADGCPWAPVGLIERIRALVPRETGA